jgi:hypothetical protein
MLCQVGQIRLQTFPLFFGKSDLMAASQLFSHFLRAARDVFPAKQA